MATCPNCQVSSREDPTAMEVIDVLTARPLGAWSLAGATMKVSAYRTLRLQCRCGWSIEGWLQPSEETGRIEDGRFVGNPSTQIWPQESP